MFKLYSPQQLRDAIEIELQKTNDAKTASIIAIKKLEKDPTCYENMQKSKKNKIIKTSFGYKRAIK